MEQNPQESVSDTETAGNDTYVPPAIESIVTAEELEREVHYAGGVPSGITRT